MRKEVVQNIWIGNLLSLQNLASDFDDKIIVISLISAERILFLTKFFLSAEKNNNNARSEEHIVWKLPDRPAANFLDSSNLIQTLKAMDQRERRPCLVHCAQGKSRSAALVAAWLISRQNMSFEEAIKVIRRVQPEANPNLGFVAALKVLERHKGNVEAAIEEWNGRIAKKEETERDQNRIFS